MENNLEELKRLGIFAAVVEAGSFTAAARNLGLAKSAVSRQVSLLEEHLGAPLLARTTRRLSLTEAGRALHQRAARMMAEADAGLAELRGLAERPAGVLRVSAPQQLGQLEVADAALGFQRSHAGVAVELMLDDAYVDLVADNIDVAVRVGSLRDSALVARRLADADVALCAAPSLLEGRPPPSHPDELADFDWVIYTLDRSPHRLTLIDPAGERVHVRMRGPMRTNSGCATHNLVRAGAGLAPLPRFYVDEDLASGRLVRLLPEYSLPPAQIHAVFVAGRDVLPKVRLFVDYLAESMARSCP